MSEKDRILLKIIIVSKIKRYLMELGNPISSSSVDGVTAKSYQLSTIREILRLVESSDDDPAMVISEFIKSVNRRSGLLFRVAYETSVDLYDHLFA